MYNDGIGKFDNYPNAQEMWNQPKIVYGGTSMTRLRTKMLKFGTYRINPQHSVVEHLKVMSTKILQLTKRPSIATNL